MTSGIEGGTVDESQRVTEVDRGTVEDLLSDPHCRYLLAFLDEADGPVQVSTAARHVVADITDSDPEAVSGDVQRRVQTWLHHGQLPRLAERDIVEFDPESNTVALAGANPV